MLRSAYTDASWSQEPLVVQVERTLALLASTFYEIFALNPENSQIMESILARCLLMSVLLDDEESGVEELLAANDDETMNLIKFNLSFPLINAVLMDESFPYALRLNTMRLLSSALKGKSIEVRCNHSQL